MFFILAVGVDFVNEEDADLFCVDFSDIFPLEKLLRVEREINISWNEKKKKKSSNYLIIFYGFGGLIWMILCIF